MLDAECALVGKADSPAPTLLAHSPAEKMRLLLFTRVKQQMLRVRGGARVNGGTSEAVWRHVMPKGLGQQRDATLHLDEIGE